MPEESGSLVKGIRWIGKGELRDDLFYLELFSSIKLARPQKLICSHRSESIDLLFFSR